MRKKIIIILTAVCSSILFLFGLLILYKIQTKHVVKEILLTEQPFEIDGDNWFIFGDKDYFQNNTFCAGNEGNFSIYVFGKSLSLTEYNFEVIKYDKPEETEFILESGDSIKLEKDDIFPHVFTSSAPEEIEVTEDGQVTVLNPDAIAVITDKINDYLEINYTFISKPIEIQCDKNKLYVGEKAHISINGYNKDIAWRVSGETAVIKDNVITAKKAGKAVFSCEIGQKEYKVFLDVFDNPKCNDMEMKIGETLKIQSQNLIDDSVKYEIEDPEIAEYSDGAILAISPGTTHLKGTIHDIEFSSTITVKEPFLAKNDNEVNYDSKCISYMVKEGETLEISLEDCDTEYTITVNGSAADIEETNGNTLLIKGIHHGMSLLSFDINGFVIEANVLVQWENTTISREKWMKTVDNWCDYMIKDGDWIYSNENNRKNVDLAIKESHRTNCAVMVVHSMQKAGVLSKNNWFYSGDNHEKMGTQQSWDEIAKYAEIIEVNGITAKEAGVKRGDICLWNGHVNIFAGYDSKGRQTWYDAGSKMTIDGKKGSVFQNFFRVGNRSKPLFTIIRLHYEDVFDS